MDDALSNVLRKVDLKSHGGGVYGFAPPWGYRTPEMKGHYQMYIVRRGTCVLESPAMPEPVLLATGDAVLISRETEHVLHDGSHRVVQPHSEMADHIIDCKVLCEGPTSPNAAWVMTVDFSIEGLMAGPVGTALGPFVHLRGDVGPTAAWLQGVLGIICEEVRTQEPGYAFVRFRLLELLFIQFLRTNLRKHREAREDICELSILCALFDPQLGKAIELIHARPDHPWTVAELATQVAMSRTAFSVKFSEITGISPLSFVTQWRMMQATEYLKQGQTMEQVSSRVGYDSVAAFSRAYKREIGVAPGTVRKSLVGV